MTAYGQQARPPQQQDSTMPKTDPVRMEFVRAKLREHRSRDLHDEPAARAAVALVLQEGSKGPEFLAIHRAERLGDPWSGHMALPGGRAAISDVSLAATAARETWEEVGIHVGDGATHHGKLDDIRATSAGRPVDLIISPFTFILETSKIPVPNPNEVQATFWIPLRELVAQDPKRTSKFAGHRPTFRGYPAFVHGGNPIWGLTYRILETLLDILGGRTTAQKH